LTQSHWNEQIRYLAEPGKQRYVTWNKSNVQRHKGQTVMLATKMQRYCNYTSVYITEGWHTILQAKMVSCSTFVVSFGVQCTNIKYVSSFRIRYICGKEVASRWFWNRQKLWVMYKCGQQHENYDCIDSRLLMDASLSPRFASSTDLITSTSMSGNMSCMAATSSSVTGRIAAAGCGCGGLPALAGTAVHTDEHLFVAKFHMKLVYSADSLVFFASCTERVFENK